LKDRYIFPAIFDYAPDGINVSFPDLPGCLTCGDDTEEAIYMAKDILPSWLALMNRDGESIPEPSEISNIQRKENEVIVLIDVWMTTHIDTERKLSIKKTVTIPQWLDEAALNKDVNFSQTLQNAIK